jgi:tellurite resistance protein TerC
VIDPVLMPFVDWWWLYGTFTLGVLALLALDLGVFHRQAHEVRFREALTWSVVWVALAGAFNLWLWWYASQRFGAETGGRLGLEFLAGYLIEKALSVDNVFVFALVFTAFAIPPALQHRVLFYGILGALVFRALFIAAGSALMDYRWVVVAAGVFLVLTGIKMMVMGGKPADPRASPALRVLRRFLPVSDRLDGQRFLVREGGSGRLMATPLLAALAVIEVADVVFAIDSVPAIFAITREPLIVFTSNVFAILGLRAMFFLLAGVMDRFWALVYALGAILVFVGLKMAWLNQAFGGKFPIWWSLGIIAALLVAGVAVSLLRRPPAAAGGGGDRPR